MTERVSAVPTHLLSVLYYDLCLCWFVTLFCYCRASSSCTSSAFEQHHPPHSHSHSIHMSLPSHLQNAWVVRYGQHVTHFIATCVGAWVHTIIVRAAAEVIKHAHRVVVVHATRCAPFCFYFCSADVPQSEHGVHTFPGQVRSHHHQRML